MFCVIQFFSYLTLRYALIGMCCVASCVVIIFKLVDLIQCFYNLQLARACLEILSIVWSHRRMTSSCPSTIISKYAATTSASCWSSSRKLCRFRTSKLLLLLNWNLLLFILLKVLKIFWGDSIYKIASSSLQLEQRFPNYGSRPKSGSRISAKWVAEFFGKYYILAIYLLSYLQSTFYDIHKLYLYFK